MTRPTRLFNRHFFLLWQGQLVSQLGAQGFVIATMFWIKGATGSATLMGALMMLTHLPAVVLGAVGGAVADRFSRRRIILLCDLVSGAAVLALAALVFWQPQQVDLILVAIFVTSILVAVSGAFFRPAISAAIPDLVPKDHLARANTFHQMGTQTATLIGQAVGGVLFRLIGAPLLFLADGLSYLFSAASESFITIPQDVPDKQAGWRQTLAALKEDSVAGIAYVWQNPELRAAGIFSFFWNIATAAVFSLVPFYVEDHLGASTDWYGFLMGGFGATSAIGSVGAGYLAIKPQPRGLLLLLMLGGLALSPAILAQIHTPLTALGLLGLLGLLSGFIGIHFATAMQLASPSQMRGRVFGVMYLLGGVYPLSVGLAGIVADLTDKNIALIYTCCSAMLVGVCAGLAFYPPFRRFVSYDPAHSAD